VLAAIQLLHCSSGRCFCEGADSVVKDAAVKTRKLLCQEATDSRHVMLSAKEESARGVRDR